MLNGLDRDVLSNTSNTTAGAAARGMRGMDHKSNQVSMLSLNSIFHCLSLRQNTGHDGPRFAVVSYSSILIEALFFLHHGRVHSSFDVIHPHANRANKLPHVS